MSSRMVLALAAVSWLTLAPAGAAHASEADPALLRPMGHWQLDMAENKCRIARSFGSEDNRHVFYLEQWSPSDEADWAVAGPAVGKYRAGRKVDFAFGPGGDAASVDFVETSLGAIGRVVGARSTVVWSANRRAALERGEEFGESAGPRGLPLLDSAGAAGIETLTLSQKGRDPVRLDLGSLDAPVAAMNRCMEDLVEHWGFDLERQRQIVTPPEILNAEMVARYVSQEYPRDALRAGAQANFFLRLTIDEMGEIEDCKLVNQTLAKDFDMARHPCTMFTRHARIEPARDATGQAMRTYYTTRIIYRISAW